MLLTAISVAIDVGIWLVAEMKIGVMYRTIHRHTSAWTLQNVTYHKSNLIITSVLDECGNIMILSEVVMPSYLVMFRSRSVMAM